MGIVTYVNEREQMIPYRKLQWWSCIVVLNLDLCPRLHMFIKWSALVYCGLQWAVRQAWYLPA